MANIKEENLTLKQQAYCEEYIRNGYNGTRAYLTAFPDCTNPDVACNQAVKLNKMEKIQNYIKTLQAENVRRFGDLAEAIINELSNDAFGLDEDGKKSPTWQKSIDLLQKQLGLQSIKTTLKVDDVININILGEDDGNSQSEHQ